MGPLNNKINENWFIANIDETTVRFFFFLQFLNSFNAGNFQGKTLIIILCKFSNLMNIFFFNN